MSRNTRTHPCPGGCSLTVAPRRLACRRTTDPGQLAAALEVPPIQATGQLDLLADEPTLFQESP
jgi:hypothetical protein